MSFIILAGQSIVYVHAIDMSSLDLNLQILNLKDRMHIEKFLVPTSSDVLENQSNDIELVGIVTKVVDGDTLDINGIRIRLALVDTPEINQPGYNQAKEFVESLCLGKKGELDVDSGQRRGDRHGREIGVVYCDGVNMNEKLMSNKLAKILVEFCDITEFSTENWTVSQCQGSR
ncbi:MAG TPA: thermonuclease family protein [Nitrososphaeraceae archaeon]|nr:thermonuclease family protein [Nitrososphaeraceae archaeon]